MSMLRPVKERLLIRSLSYLTYINSPTKLIYKFATRQGFREAVALLMSVGAKLTIGADESDADEQLAALCLASNEN